MSHSYNGLENKSHFKVLVEIWPILMGYKELPIEVQILEEDWTVRDMSFRQKLWVQIHPHIRSNLAQCISNLVYVQSA